jgi:hypothetical protein
MREGRGGGGQGLGEMGAAAQRGRAARVKGETNGPDQGSRPNSPT